MAPARLSDQCALVTGASSGIGAAVACAMAREGASVAVNYRSNARGAEDLVDDIVKAGGRATAIRADVSVEEDVLSMFARFQEVFGRIDILVANAGLQDDAPFTSMTHDQWNHVLQVNLTGQFLCAREAVRRFMAQPRDESRSRARGKIVCMSSVHQLIPWGGRVNYAASKGGVMLMMQSLAQEVAPQGIRVNGIAPGAIRTHRSANRAEAERQDQRVLELIPYGRVGEPDDIARAAVWLASDESDYVVGTTLFVDGGMSLYPAFLHNG